MNSLEITNHSKILSIKESRRYALQINNSGIGIAGQEKLKRAKVLVIGAGGKGTVVLQHLATVGVGKIGISDNFQVEETELSRQFLYGNGDLGKQKAIISKQKLLEINHLVDYELHNVFLTDENIPRICSDYDILVDATDNYQAHIMLHKAALKLKKPLVYGSVDDAFGEVSVFNYMGGPSFKCLYPTEPTKSILNDHDGFSCLVSVIGVVGSIIANETLKVILGKETDLSGNLLKFNGADYSFRYQKINKNLDNFRIE